MRRTEVYLVDEFRNAARISSFEDRRMWRLMLARLHPDAGGDHDLFVFACALREEVSRGERDQAGDDKAQNTAPFLRTWYAAMGQWSSSNRDSMYNSRTR